MRLRDLLERDVVDRDGRRLGAVHDVRLVQDGPVLSSGFAAFRLHGLVVGRAGFGTRLGYADAGPGEVRGPLALRTLIRWLHGRAVYVSWDRVISVEPDRIVIEGSGV